jgi:site-specific recombinase XerD
MGLPSKKTVLPQIKRQTKLPVVLNKTEVKELLAAPKYLKHRLLLGMLYGCGLRSYELCNLRLADIDFERETVFVKKQKGNRDRIVPLSLHLKRGLQEYINTEHPEEWLFNSQVTKEGKLQPLTTAGVRWVVKENRTKVSTHKKIVPHTLRHTYATHLLEEGLNLLSLKELLGHARIETTLIYLQVANRGSSVKFSPLDTLYAPL